MYSIAPITGKFRKSVIRDISVSLGLGTALGYAYWWGVHLPANSQRDQFYLKLAKEKEANN
ncbi:hypothetical protein E3Q22_03800 [Wallemia mellicola]|uniref:Cytochrome c oxidase subunit 9, mitochondrial n=2 Tax=Wallemia mellicola TaxID=1708541 RepID=A0A4T0TBR1_9BASI|nr:cytochrome c oxidase subunit 7A [Wallemia mellicola CBS 633.66]TIB71527.1 hypothetical protein E3Q23_03761 [Wallemia mellicola]EIM21751.1 cytochrome c oxidase subunit 7A [Wallemia mellicola CBS 633.66]TIB72445.1 hypothetical protein E3Q24_01743 [Wallemia mellicola]TIB75925.1 hypothetical protein E3Q22_03800 [Wallemia mellicola]TIB82002.1 hypothetical protein E3Q21_03542 [Wallemia mellicola]|eukprot:XP_006958061.1 cytochrome c oxidase subunit 7A [Wallemia mellicola CBS 633.66]